jgi:CIC family chloride channel protein
LLYLALGLLAGIISLAFVKMLYGTEAVFDRWRFPEYLKPMLGGLMIGALGVAFPQVFGTGYGPQPLGGSTGPLDLVLLAKLGIGLTAALTLLKIIATSLTIGSGGSGGVFAPSLFVGAMLGSTFGQITHHFWPQITAGSGAYALVGMGAVFAGAARAPITSVLILFEMTGDYRIILPMMIAVVTSSLLSQRLSRETIYTMKIRRRGIDLQRPTVTDLLDTVTVGEVMTRESEMVPLGMGLNELLERFTQTGHHGFLVVDAEEKLAGIVTTSDVQRSTIRGEADLTVADIATLSPLTCFPDQTVGEALAQLEGREVGRIPVVDRLAPGRVLGILRRQNIIAAYSQLLKEHSSLQSASQRLRLSVLGLVSLQVTIPAAAEVIGIPLSSIAIPSDALLIAVRRQGRTVIPRGETALAAGDVVTALASPAGAERVRSLLTRLRSSH